MAFATGRSTKQPVNDIFLVNVGMLTRTDQEKISKRIHQQKGINGKC